MALPSTLISSFMRYHGSSCLYIKKLHLWNTLDTEDMTLGSLCLEVWSFTSNIFKEYFNLKSILT